MLQKYKKIFRNGLLVVVAIVVIVLFYLNFIYSPTCQNYECWQKRMVKCERTSFVNEQKEASWGYEIKGKSEKECFVEVTLLLAKKGELGINEIIGDTMTCEYPLGSVTYAEKDLSACHGPLKEDLQELIISKLHSYILENLGQVSEGLEQAI